MNPSRLTVKDSLQSKHNSLIVAMVTLTMNVNGDSHSTSNGLATKLFGAFHGLRNLSEEVEHGPVSEQTDRARIPSVISCSGAQSLAAAHAHRIVAETRDHGIVAKAHAEHEETQQVLAILMANPTLWLQFKSRLHSSTLGTGTIGIQAALKDFMSDHPEIEEQLLKTKKQAETQKTLDRQHYTRRMSSILGTVSTFTAELSREISVPSPIINSGSSTTSDPTAFQIDTNIRRRCSMESQGSTGSTELSVKPTSVNGLMSSAGELGLRFLRRATEVAGTSIEESSILSTDDYANMHSSDHFLTPPIISPTSFPRGSSKLETSNGLVAVKEKDEDGTSEEEGFVKLNLRENTTPYGTSSTAA